MTNEVSASISSSIEHCREPASRRYIGLLSRGKRVNNIGRISFVPMLIVGADARYNGFASRLYLTGKISGRRGRHRSRRVIK